MTGVVKKRSLSILVKTEWRPNAMMSTNIFYKFGMVSPWLYCKMMVANEVAHTDIVKCRSTGWLPKNITKNKKNISELIINNCKNYLKLQILKYKPLMIICNGIPASNAMRDFIPPVSHMSDEKFPGKYKGNLDGREVWIITTRAIGGTYPMGYAERKNVKNLIESVASDIGLR